MVVVRDSDRRQVYFAEDLSAENTILVLNRSLELLQSVVERVLDSRWWRTNSVGDPAAVGVWMNRSALRSCWQAETRRISLSPNGVDLSTLCHELAHAAVTDFALPGGPPQPNHGPHFRTLHVAVRHLVLGKQCGDDLAEVYHQFGLASGLVTPAPAGPPPWSAPVLSPSIYEAAWLTEPGVLVAGREPRNATGAIAL
ncbi:MAG: hypothetical protein HKN03_17265 [Acidimicrobiales bacterium]|nr:hypothetical protein [Acidimicrobiales bacterium]